MTVENVSSVIVIGGGGGGAAGRSVGGDEDVALASVAHGNKASATSSLVAELNSRLAKLTDAAASDLRQLPPTVARTNAAAIQSHNTVSLMIVVFFSRSHRRGHAGGKTAPTKSSSS